MVNFRTSNVFKINKAQSTKHRPANSAKWKQLLLLTWKNFKLQIRHPVVTLLELGVPAFFSLILVLVRSVISSDYVPESTIYSPFSIDQLPITLRPKSAPQWQLLYTPKSAFLDDIMKTISSDLKVEPRGFENENLMEKYYSNSSKFALAGIVFGDNLKEGINSTTEINYTIRPRSAEAPKFFLLSSLKLWWTGNTFPIYPILGPRIPNSTWGGHPGYMSKGFLPIQHTVAMNFVKKLVPDFSKKFQYDVLMSRYPYPRYLYDLFIIALGAFFPTIVCFSFIYPAVNIVKNVVVEKEKKMKEAMKMMGLSKWLHWTAWYFKYFLFLCISCAIITLLLCVKVFNDMAVINRSDPTVIFVWLMLYTASVIPFCFFLSTLFNKANSAAAGSGVIFFLSFLPYFFIFTRYKEIPYITKVISCLIPNLALSTGSMVLTTTEAIGNGLQWDNINFPPSTESNLAMSTTFVMFIVDGIIFLFLTWYTENVFPGEYGVPERWNFLFTRSYWCGHHSSGPDMKQIINSDVKSTDYFENDPLELKAGIQIHNLTKVYKKGPPAVNDLSINMYQSQITALLGHNGAGKTTTISMLTGLVPPTSGTAVVNGYDICEDIDSVHSNLGICPQHDILFDELTVEEHLYFFCKLKGCMSNLVPSEIDRIITSLSLEPYRNTRSEYLSGGWKRKVSVAIAFVGGSKIVILDEPTSGMDPFNRRALWEVLETEKVDRTILLTTHFMEEADALGDRIAIMANGEIQCCGSSMFLKKRYGAGYHLVMVKDPDCDVPLVTKIIMSHVPDAEETSNIGGELKYSLPTESSHLFSDLFRELDQRRDELNIYSYGASITTMEEVFIKVGDKTSASNDVNVDNQIPKNKESILTIDSGIHINSAFVDDSGVEVDVQSLSEYHLQFRNSGFKLYMQHLYALLKKRILHSFRNKSLTLTQLVLPAFFLMVILIALKTVPLPKDSSPLLLDVSAYQSSEIPYFVDTAKESQDLGTVFASQFHKPNIPELVNSSTIDVTEFLLNKATEDLGKYNMHNMIGAKFEKNGTKGTITSLFNNQAYHSPAVALLGTDNTILKYLTNNSFKFVVTNHPMPRTLANKGKQEQTELTESYQISQVILFGMSFLIASFAVFIVKERASNSKHLQRVSGMSLSSYWLASFLWDFLNYLIPCCLVFLVFVAFQTKGLSSPDAIGNLFLLFSLHGFATLPFIYCCTFYFYSPSTAYVRLCLFNILAGIACLLATTVLEVPDLGVQYAAKPIEILFSALMPTYALGRGVGNLYQNGLFNKYCNRIDVKFLCRTEFPRVAFDLIKPCCKGKCNEECIPWESNFFSLRSPGIGSQLICFAVQAIVFTFILILLEKKFLRYVKYKIRGSKITPNYPEELQNNESFEDDDVHKERIRIMNAPLQQLFTANHLVVMDVVKQYGSTTSVNKVAFGVQKGECFGLLGTNGAGKTTTFKMITGDVTISSGDIYVDGFNVKKQMRKVQSRIGYCPQFDALIDELTGRETLTLFSKLRGIPNDQIEAQIKTYSELLSFTIHVDKLVKHYSGGNKRKLSTAVALIGNSPVIFLDEPTTGMDPVSRRCMWSAILQIMQSGRSVILTSHSMEECEALCTRLAIMVNGKFCCLGSPQRLKTKFGEGFTLLVKVGRPQSMDVQLSNNMTSIPEHPRTTRASIASSTNDVPPAISIFKADMNEIKAFVKNTFVSATLKSAHENQLLFHIPSTGLSWAEIFGSMEKAKNSLNIEDYTVGETTLEQVFLNFALTQRTDERA